MLIAQDIKQHSIIRVDNGVKKIAFLNIVKPKILYSDYVTVVMWILFSKDLICSDFITKDSNADCSDQRSYIKPEYIFRAKENIIFYITCSFFKKMDGTCVCVIITHRKSFFSVTCHDFKNFSIKTKLFFILNEFLKLKNSLFD